MEAFKGVVKKVCHVAHIVTYCALTTSSIDGINCLSRRRRNTTNMMQWMKKSPWWLEGPFLLKRASRWSLSVRLNHKSFLLETFLWISSICWIKEYIHGATGKQLRRTFTWWITDVLDSYPLGSCFVRKLLTTSLVVWDVKRFSEMISTRIADRWRLVHRRRVRHLSIRWWESILNLVTLSSITIQDHIHLNALLCLYHNIFDALWETGNRI